MTKRSRKKAPARGWAIRVLVISLIILFAGIISIASYKKGHRDGVIHAKQQHEQTQAQQEALLSKITDIAAPKNDLVGKLQDVLKKEQASKQVDASHEFDTSRLGRPPQGPVRTESSKQIYSTFKKPKLAIIMDDVSFAHDVNAIKALKFPITMSFLPPSPTHPDSAILASKENVYMVHLPLEAMHFSAEEPITLRVSDSRDVIRKRVKQVKELFPRAYYVNNHTGSRFTSNQRAVKELVKALEKEGIGFLDSRTTAQTKVPKVMASLGKPYIARDLFLDHEADVSYIEGQIKKAISKAKKHGSAIAIGHPRKETLQALHNSKSLLKSVELVYINKLI